VSVNFAAPTHDPDHVADKPPSFPREQQLPIAPVWTRKSRSRATGKSAQRSDLKTPSEEAHESFDET
jgi:hypothetical protein